MTAQEIIDMLNMAPHPEGGHFVETWRPDGPGRPCGTAIYFLLQGSETNHWHKVDATEIWHYHAGAPLILSISASDDGPARRQVLGADLAADERPQLIVPEGHWQKAQSTGDWTLVGCTVSPGFEYEGFTLAPEGFDIPSA